MALEHSLLIKIRYMMMKLLCLDCSPILLYFIFGYHHRQYLLLNYVFTIEFNKVFYLRAYYINFHSKGLLIIFSDLQLQVWLCLQ